MVTLTYHDLRRQKHASWVEERNSPSPRFDDHVREHFSILVQEIILREVIQSRNNLSRAGRLQSSCHSFFRSRGGIQQRSTFQVPRLCSQERDCRRLAQTPASIVKPL